MFSLEKWILNQFAVVPTVTPGGDMRFQLQCGCCAKSVIQYPVSGDKFRCYAGAILETHIFGSKFGNHLCFSNDVGGDNFYMEDIQVNQCKNFFTPSRIRCCMRHLMEDLGTRKIDVKDISRATFCSFKVLINMMTDPKHLLKLEEHMLLSNKLEIEKIENKLRRDGKEINHGWENLFSKSHEIIKNSNVLIHDNMIDTSFSDPSTISTKNQQLQKVTDDTLLYHWTHIELVDPATRHPALPFPNNFPKWAIAKNQKFFIGYATVKTLGGDKEFAFLPSHNYTGSPDYKTSGELSRDFILGLELNVKTELMESDKKRTLQDAVISERRRSIYSVRLVLTHGTNYGNKRNKLGCTYQIEACDRPAGPFYVVSEKHLREIYQDEDQGWIEDLFDIRTTNTEIVAPKFTNEDEDEDEITPKLPVYEIKKRSLDDGIEKDNKKKRKRKSNINLKTRTTGFDEVKNTQIRQRQKIKN